MLVKQLSVFLENKKDRLRAAAEVLAEHGVNIRALSLADTSDFGILRMIVDRPERGKEVLTDAGIFVRVTDVIAVSMDDAPGGTLAALRILSGHSINVEYMYACVGKFSDRALMILQVDRQEEAEKLMEAAGFSPTEALL